MITWTLLSSRRLSWRGKGYDLGPTVLLRCSYRCSETTAVCAFRFSRGVRRYNKERTRGVCISGLLIFEVLQVPFNILWGKSWRTPNVIRWGQQSWLAMSKNCWFRYSEFLHQLVNCQIFLMVFRDLFDCFRGWLYLFEYLLSYQIAQLFNKIFHSF